MLATFILLVIAFGFAILIPNIGDAMTILGATTNSAIGFVFPIIFYLKLERKLPTFSGQKITAYIVLVTIIICSIIEIGTFVYKKVNNLG